MNNNPHVGSCFDDFLDEENLLDRVNEIAIKRVIDWQLQQEIMAIDCSIDSDKKSK
jgi:antitoxin HicB